MFYKENGVAHYKCDHCGAVDDLRRFTVERWEAQIVVRDSRAYDECPTFVDCSDTWVECARCGEKLQGFDVTEINDSLGAAKELKHD